MKTEHVDVVVVGLGPVGAVVANLLGAHGSSWPGSPTRRPGESARDPGTTDALPMA